MAVYTIEQLHSLHDFKDGVIEFLEEEVPKLSARFGDKFNYKKVMYEAFAQSGIFLVARRDGEVTGMMIAFLNRSPFDYETVILKQQLFYVKENAGRTAYHLFQKFIDIGRKQANHIITMLTSETNIKPQTLKSMGFEELETWYRMEV